MLGSQARRGDTRRFVLGVIVLSLASAIVRAISVRFNVYLADHLGSDGLGLLTLTLAVYSPATTLATSAVGFASTRLVSEAIGSGHPEKIRPSMVGCVLYSLSFGIPAAILLFVLSEPISRYLPGDMRTMVALRTLALSLPLVSLGSVLSGYFTAVGRVARSSLAQVVGLIFRVFVTARLLCRSGMSLSSSLSAVGVGMVLSEAVTLALSVIVYLADRRGERVVGEGGSVGRRRLVRIALPMAVSSYVRSGLGSIEHLLIPYGLKKKGYSESEALRTYARVQSMALPVVMFGYSFLTPFCSMLLPEIARRQVGAGGRSVRSAGDRAISFTAFFGIGTAGILAAFGGEIGRVVCGSVEAGRYIKFLAPLVPIMYMDTCVDSLLKGVDEQRYTMLVNMLDSILSVAVVFILTPRIGVWGFIAEIYICEILNAALSVARLVKRVGVKIDGVFDVLLPIAAVISGTTVGGAVPLDLWGRVTVAVIVYAAIVLGGRKLR